MRGTVGQESGLRRGDDRRRRKKRRERARNKRLFEFSDRHDRVIRVNVRVILIVSVAELLEACGTVNRCHLLRGWFAGFALVIETRRSSLLDQILEGRKTVELAGDELILLRHI